MQIPKNIVRPAHYTSYEIEPIAVINSWDLNFNLGNVVKYLARAGKKRGNSRVQDLQKARQYLTFEIERYGNNPHNPSQEQMGDVAGEQVVDASDASGGEVS
jgi:hypothetical protein